MSDSFKEYLTVRDHLDPDKHWIGETLPAPTQGELAATVGTLSGPGDSPFPARADHMHKIDPALIPKVAAPAWFGVFPGAATDATTSTTFITWLTCSTIVIPTWVTTVWLQVNITNIFMLTAASTTYYLTATVGTAAYGASDYAGFTPAAITERHSISFAIAVVGFTPGTRTVIIGARRASGTGVLRADTACQITGLAYFS